MDPRETLVLQQRAIDALKERIASESYMSIEQVRTRLKLSRAKVESIPFEVLPYTDCGSGTREYRRYHPADVLAADARIRGWRRAQAEGRSEQHLAELREQLEEADRAAIRTALEMRRAS